MIKKKGLNMYTTENYEIVFSFVEGFRFNKDFVVYNLFTAGRNEFRRSGIDLDARVSEQTMVCVDCAEQEMCIVVNILRNPAIAPDREAFVQAVGNVVKDVRESMDYPYTTFSIFLLQVSLFTRLEVEGT